MSKAFTKEDDGDAALHLEDLPQSSHPNFVSAAGLAALHDRLDELRSQLMNLRASQDVADQRLAIATLERDIRFVEGRIQRAVVVSTENNRPDIVSFGAEVSVVDSDGNTRKFRIVGEDETDPNNGLISPFSPLGKALVGAELGSVVEWIKPGETVDLEITGISFPKP